MSNVIDGAPGLTYGELVNGIYDKITESSEDAKTNSI